MQVSVTNEWETDVWNKGDVKRTLVDRSCPVVHLLHHITPSFGWRTWRIVSLGTGRTRRLPDPLIIQERFTMNDRNICGEQRTESNTTETDWKNPLNHGYKWPMPRPPVHSPTAHATRPQDSSWLFPNIYKSACICEFYNTLSLLILSLSFDHFQSSASNQSEWWLGTLRNPTVIRKWVSGNAVE